MALWPDMEHEERVAWLASMTGQPAEDVEQALEDGETSFVAANNPTHSFSIDGDGAWQDATDDCWAGYETDDSDGSDDGAGSDSDDDADDGAGDDASEELDVEALEAMTVPALKDLLTARGLPTSGNKAELIDRLTIPQE